MPIPEPVSNDEPIVSAAPSQPPAMDPDAVPIPMGDGSELTTAPAGQIKLPPAALSN
ncbi:MAG: hypothetical protein II885_08120 [Oscillospiraceae bacterium]|nr:hypothetical protein [Oscillospiraceae bacterium]